MDCKATNTQNLPAPWQLAAFDTVEELANIGSYTWHPQTNRMTWSDQLYRLFGMFPGSVAPSLPAFVELVHEDDKALFARAMTCAEHREFGHPVELRIRRHSDRSECWLKVGLASPSPRPKNSSAPLFGIVVDVTEERALASMLRHATHALDRVESAGSLGSFDYDFVSDELVWSDQMYRIHGLERRSALPDVRTILEVVHPDDRQFVAERLLSGLCDEPATDLKYRIVLQDGAERHLVARLAWSRDEQGSLIGLSGVAIDSTEQRRTEEQLRHSQRLEDIGRLAGGIAHDFNNLLLVILATTELARQSSRNDVVEPELDRIEEAAIRAADLVRQLLIFARGRPSAPELLDFAEVLPRTSRLLERVLGDEVELELTLPIELWPIFADKGQIEQVMLNLAINARDAMPDGGTIEVSARNTWIKHPAQAAEDCHVAIKIKDSGNGMDASTIAHIFDPFFSTKPTGTGLGLTTCKNIVESWGGFIRAQSTPGAGSTFELFFPRARGTPDKPTEDKKPALARGSERVLVVDDSAAVRSVAQRLLEFLGYRVLTARSASEARVMLSSGRTPIDLLITDLAMPRESGAAFVRRLRASHPGLRALVISARTEIAEGLEQELGPVLMKPFTLEQLANAVRAALG